MAKVKKKARRGDVAVLMYCAEQTDGSKRRSAEIYKVSSTKDSEVIEVESLLTKTSVPMSSFTGLEYVRVGGAGDIDRAAVFAAIKARGSSYFATVDKTLAFLSHFRIS